MFGINKKLKSKNLATKKQKDRVEKVKDNNLKKSTNVPDLICKSYTDGCLVLGCVHDITGSELMVSLPGIGNFGYVKLNNISKVYSESLKSEESLKSGETKTLFEMYNRGDLVRCKVLNYSDRRLHLTIEPDQVNGGLTFDNLEPNMIICGAIKTKEDHGYTVDLGIDDLSGFLRTNDTTLNFSIGQCSLFKIESKKSKRAISLELCDSSQSSFYDLKTKFQFDTYLPGARLINCTVEKVSKGGLQLNISNQLHAYVHINHVPAAKRAYLAKSKKSVQDFDTSSAKFYSNGDKLTGTIIFINPYSRVIYMSLLPHLNDSTKPAKITKLFLEDRTENGPGLKLGQVIDEAQVSMVTQKEVYVKFKIGEDKKQITGFVPKKQLFESDKTEGGDNDEEDDDEDEEKVNGEKLKKIKKDAKNMTKEELLKHFPMNSTLKARIYDFNLIEDIILLSVRNSVLNASCLAYDELKVGQVVKCTITSINSKNGGVAVKLSDFVRGFIPKIHTGDTPLSETLIGKKLKVGAEIKAKILSLNPNEKRCILTAKKTLVKSKLPLIDSFDEKIEIGMETYGVVVSIQEYGLLVGFLNELKGLLPRDQISKAAANKAQKLNELYSVGQLLKCRVMEFNREKKLIKLSLLMGSLNENQSKKKEAKSAMTKEVEQAHVDLDYQIGDMIETATILDVNEKTGFFRLRLPRGSKNGIIYKPHLSDIDSLNDALFDYYKKRMSMENLLVVNHQETFDQIGIRTKISRTCVTLTLKSTLVDYWTANSTMKPDTIPKSFQDLTVNVWHHGWVRKVLANGILVEMLHNLNGFCANDKIDYLSDLKLSENGLNVGESILFKITQLFADKNRFITNIKTRFDLSNVNQCDTQFMVEVFKSFLVNTKRLFQFYAAQKTLNSTSLWEKATMAKVEIGATLKVAVKSYNQATSLLECVFMSDMEKNGFNTNTELIGHAFLDDSSVEQENAKAYKPGQQMEALVLGFDPITKVFCLLVDQKKIKVYKKNFDSSFRAKTACKLDQELKAEVLFVSCWFCIVGLKQHAVGRLAVMPLFKNEFTQLNTFRARCNEEYSKIENKVDIKIKQKQVSQVSAAHFTKAEETSTTNSDAVKKFKKADKRFSYFSVGQIIKVKVNENSADTSSDLELLIVRHDSSSMKTNKKSILRELAVLNENRVVEETLSRKRKLDNGHANDDDDDEGELVKRKLVLNGKRKSAVEELSNSKSDNRDVIEVVACVKKAKLVDEKPSNHSNGGVDKLDFMFPWEVTDFDHFNEIISKVNNNSVEGQNGNNDELSKSAKKKMRKEKEKPIDDKTIYENEEQVFNPNRDPENSDDYERLIASKPNCSLLWIKYMVFYLQMAEIDKARNVAQQALKTILYKEDQERLNVWVALLNLENMYGTQTSLEETFNKATQNCDSYKTHCHMAEIFARSSKLQDAESVFMKMIRKFSKSPEAWIKYGIFHYKNGNFESARKLLIRSFNSLDKKDHIDMVNKFAQLEFKYGDIERGKTMYDSLLFTYQNRTDIWSVYIDMLIKHEKFEDARQIFNRIIQMGLTSKRMKFIFKKYLDFEKLHGNEESVDKVKEMAAKYVEKSAINQTEDTKLNGNTNGANLHEHLKKNLNL